MTPLGQPIPHDSATTHATGESLFIDDHPPLHGELFATIVPAPCAAGKLKRIDTSKARSMPGVYAVLLATDIPGLRTFGPVIHDEHLLIAEGQDIQYLGQPLAILAAETREQAEAARRAVLVEVDEATPILTIEEAIKANAFLGQPRHMKRGTPELFFNTPESTSRLQPAEVGLAAPRAGRSLNSTTTPPSTETAITGPLADCSAETLRHAEGTFTIGGQEHFYLETQACLVTPGEQQTYRILSSTQHPSEVQALVAETLHLPFNHIEVICPRMGGGFGGKETQAAQPAMLSALLARHTKRPIRFVYSRDDDFTFTGKRHPFLAQYKIAYDDQGHLHALDLTLTSNGGCSTDLSFAVLERAMLHSDNAYFIPHIRITGRVAKTHLPSNTAFRGFGGPQGVATIENILQRIAIETGQDAYEVRRRNLYRDPISSSEATKPLPLGEVGGTPPGEGVPAVGPLPTVTPPPHELLSREKAPSSTYGKGDATVSPALAPQTQIPQRNTTHYGQLVTNNTLSELFSQLERTSNYHTRRQQITHHNTTNKHTLKGLALSPVKFGISFTRRTLNQANALVNIYLDGSVSVSTGATEMGQGVYTRIRQLVADELGLSLPRVRVLPTSTDRNNNTSPTAASTGTDLNGAAAVQAARDLKQRLAEVAAAMLGDAKEGLNPEPSAITFESDHLFDTRSPEKTLTFPQVVQRAYELRVSLGQRGHYTTPGVDFNRDTGRGTPFLYYTNGAAVAEVEIDRLTGECTVTQVDLLMDAGKLINPAIDRGQVIGGFIQGQGWVTTEELVYNSKGLLLTHSPDTYKIPAISDIPKTFNVNFLHNENNHASLKKSKSVGEPPLLLGLSVLMAIKDAISHVNPEGAINLPLPATGEQILKALTHQPTPPAKTIPTSTPLRNESTPGATLSPLTQTAQKT